MDESKTTPPRGTITRSLVSIATAVLVIVTVTTTGATVALALLGVAACLAALVIMSVRGHAR